MRIIPSSGYALLKPIPKEREVGGFLISEDSAEAPQVATVIATRIQGMHENINVIYKSYTTTDIKLNGELHYLVHEDDILGEFIND